MGRKIQRSKKFNIDRSIPYLMNRVSALLNQRLHERLQQHGLSFQHWRVLVALAAQDNPTISDISSYAVIPHSTLSRLLDRMEREKLVKRQASTSDRRTAPLRMTARGRANLKAVIPEAVRVREEALNRLSHQEVGLLRALLTAVHATLTPGDGRLFRR